MATVTTGNGPLRETPGSTGRWAYRTSALFAFVWWLILIGMCVKTSNPPLISHPQILSATSIVAGTIREVNVLPQPNPRAGEPLPPAFCRCLVKVVETLHGDVLAEEVVVVVPGVPEDWTVGRSAIWPLIKASAPAGADGKEAWLIANLPAQRGRPLIYPDRPEFRELIRNTLEAQPPEASLGE